MSPYVHGKSAKALQKDDCDGGHEQGFIFGSFTMNGLLKSISDNEKWTYQAFEY